MGACEVDAMALPGSGGFRLIGDPNSGGLDLVIATQVDPNLALSTETQIMQA